MLSSLKALNDIEAPTRETRAKDLLEVYQSVQRNPDGSFTVQSQHTPGRSYTVVLGLNATYCNCPDATYRRIQCKHGLAVSQWIAQER